MNSMERVLSDDLTRLVDRLSASIPEGALRALDDLENVWALAAWRSAAEEPVESASQLAA